MRRCTTCHEPIAAPRLVALPATRVCATCSTEQPVKGYMTWEHKTAPVFQVVTPRQHQWLRSRDRKGMRSGLPMSSRGSSAMSSTVAPVSSGHTPSRTPIMATASNPLSLVPNATTCAHKDRPQVSSAGKCLDCALTYYRNRLLWAQLPANR